MHQGYNFPYEKMGFMRKDRSDSVGAMNDKDTRRKEKTKKTFSGT